MRRTMAGGSSAPQWEIIVGLEVHARLATRRKLFVDAPSSFAPQAPNTFVTPYCVGLPGVLPRLDEEAVRLAVRAAQALGCRVHAESRFARKHYFYPDLPKGYQITQGDRPLATDGAITIATSDGERSLGIARLHLEEDAGKLVDLGDGRTGVDFNRAGVPLIEIVTRPEAQGGDEAAAALREIRAILVAIGVNDGNLEEGSLRCDANVSVRRRGAAELGTRVEIKNVNGFRFVAKAVEWEAARQIAALERGERIASETRGFDAARRRTVSMRAKDSDADYRYLPEPDLPVLRIDDALREAERARLPELPAARRARWQGLGVPRPHAETFAADPPLGDLFDAATQALGSEDAAPAHGAQAVAQLVKTEVLRWIAEDRSHLARVEPNDLARLVEMRREGRLSSTLQKAALEARVRGAPSLEAALTAVGGAQIRDAEQIERWVDEVLAAHPDEVASYRAGKTKLIGFFVGQVMSASRRRADPTTTRRILARRLDDR